MSGMAEVLAAHSYYEYQKNLGYYRSEYLCGCGATFWAGEHQGDPALHQAVATHHAEVLTAAGFGPVKEAAAKALEDAADVLARLPYVKPGAAGRGEYERVLAVRRGDTDKWLKARAAAVRGGSA